MKSLLLFLTCSALLFTSHALAQEFHSSTDPDLSLQRDGGFGAFLPMTPGSAAARGWTKSTGAPILASTKLADLDGDGVDEALVTTYGIANPYGEGWLHAWDGAGNAMTGFPVFLSGAAPATPAVGDLDGDGDVEIVQGTWKYLYVFNADGTSATGWPKSLYVTQPAALADLDGDGDLEIIVPSYTAMRVYHHDGTAFPGFPVSGSNDLTAAAVGDLDGDGDLEIVAGSFKASGSVSDFVYAWHHDGTPVTGFPVTTAGSVKAAPALADLDGDGTMEIMANCWNKSGTDQFYVWDQAGQLEPGWPMSIPYIRLSSPSVADLDLDGDLEIIVGGWNTSPYGEVVNALHHDATTVAGFPVTLNNSPSGNVNSTPVTGEIDGDPNPEIVLKAVNNIFALNHDGTLVPGFPVFLDDTSHSGTTSPSPALGDPDGDGLVEILAASTFDTVILIDLSAAYSPAGMFWPSFRNDPENRGTYLPKSLTADTAVISEAVGGAVHFTLNAGPTKGGRKYILLASITGTSPGTPLPGGQAVLPLNWDLMTNLVLSLLNSPVFFDFSGKLGGTGKGAATFDTLGPLPPGTYGLTIHFAYALKPWNFASNPVAVKIVP